MDFACFYHLQDSDDLANMANRYVVFLYSTALGASTLGAALREDGSYTLLAPTNTAFSKMDQDLLRKILSDQRCLDSMCFDFSHSMTKPTKWPVHKAASELWSESSLRTQYVAKDPSFLHAGSEDSDQTGRVPWLI